MEYYSWDYIRSYGWDEVIIWDLELFPSPWVILQKYLSSVKAGEDEYIQYADCKVRWGQKVEDVAPWTHMNSNSDHGNKNIGFWYWGKKNWVINELNAKNNYSDFIISPVHHPAYWTTGMKGEKRLGVLLSGKIFEKMNLGTFTRSIKLVF